MITIYTSPSCASCRKVIAWFKEQGIPYVEKSIFNRTLKPEDIKEMLIKSENGTDDIISKRSKIIKEQKIDIDSMKTSELIDFVTKNPSVLKRPIMVDDHRIQVGYNADEIRSFIPRAKRIAEWACLNCPEHDNCEHPQDGQEEENPQK